MTIEVDWEDACAAASHLKIKAKGYQTLSHYCRLKGDFDGANKFDARAARLDAIADKFIKPFLNEESIQIFNATIDE